MAFGGCGTMGMVLARGGRGTGLWVGLIVSVSETAGDRYALVEDF